MTPIGHAGCGLAACGIISPVIRKIFKLPFRAQYPIAIIAALLPDIDAASLLMNHAVYSGKLWYSHHMFFHSFLAGALISAFVACIYLSGAIGIRGIRNLFRKNKIALEHRLLRVAGAFIVSYIAYCVHFLGDLPTPPGPWGGIAMYWPSATMAGGWGRIYWHNWYLIYLAIVFVISFLSTAIVAGILSSFTLRYVKWAGYAVRGVTVVIALMFSYNTYSFINTHSFKEMGFAKWDALQRSLVPKQYMTNANKYFEKATILWRTQLITRNDLIQLGNRMLARMESLHASFSPVVAVMVPASSESSDLILYKKLQAIAPGMDDTKEGLYRAWFIRDSLPAPDFFNKAFLVYYHVSRNKFYLQMSNSWMIAFRIDERNEKGEVIKVKKIVHSNKIFVPDTKWPQLNMEELKQRSFNFWDHDKIPYNLIPRRSYSRYHNTIHGLYPSLNHEPGYIYPGWKTGIAFHDGLYSEGCTVYSFGHFDIGAHLQYPYYPLWQSADKVIDINVTGSKFRGSQKAWGRTVYIRDPKNLFTKTVASNSKTEASQRRNVSR